MQIRWRISATSGTDKVQPCGKSLRMPRFRPAGSGASLCIPGPSGAGCRLIAGADAAAGAAGAGTVAAADVGIPTAVVAAAVVIAAAGIAATVVIAAAAVADAADGLVLTAGIAAGVADEIREDDAVDVGRTGIAGHMISSKKKCRGGFPPRHFMRRFLKRILPQLIPYGVVLIGSVGRQLCVGSQNRVTGFCDCALHRRYRLIPQLMGIRRMLVLFHALTPEIGCACCRFLYICTKALYAPHCFFAIIW